MTRQRAVAIALIAGLAAGCSPAIVDDEPAYCASEGEPCARTSGEAVTCSGTCGVNEVCFTQVSCGAEGTCLLASDEPADDRCHRTCASTDDCGDGETCSFIRFFGCGDFNGGAQGRGICERLCD